jgi:hypothetical protein
MGGIDIAGWENSGSKFLLHKFKCFEENKCDFYELPMSTKNSMIKVNPGNSKSYGLSIFDCGVLSDTSNVLPHCDNFQVFPI